MSSLATRSLDVVWNLDDEVTNKEEVKTLKFDNDPLITVVTLLRSNIELFQIYECIRYEEDVPKPPGGGRHVVTTEDIEKAAKIRTLFKNRMILRRLQGQPISEFMQKLERILEKDREVDSDCVAVLIKLPDFHDENVAVSEIFKRSTSIPDYLPDGDNVMCIDSPITLEGEVFHSDKNSKYTTYFWKTKQGFLIAIDVPVASRCGVPWKFISTLKNLSILGNFRVSTRAGYDFKLARPFRGDYEIYHT